MGGRELGVICLTRSTTPEAVIILHISRYIVHATTRATSSINGHNIQDAVMSQSKMESRPHRPTLSLCETKYNVIFTSAQYFPY